MEPSSELDRAPPKTVADQLTLNASLAKLIASFFYTPKRLRQRIQRFGADATSTS